MAIFDPGGTNPTRVSCSGIVPWDKVARLGEATNPGPVVKFSTLNIVSAGKNQSVMLEPQTTPSVQVYTETCMTKVIQESLSRKVRSHKKAMISSALCNPRQNVIRGASYTRGQSGGVLIMSDIPAQPGHFPMPLATWASTRVVDAVVAAAPGFHIRILGIYGITAKIKTHADMTNDLLRSILGSVAHSTLPCLIMGDFNCPLEELVSWPSMQLHGWVDAATWNETLGRTGEKRALILFWCRPSFADIGSSLNVSLTPFRIMHNLSCTCKSPLSLPRCCVGKHAETPQWC